MDGDDRLDGFELDHEGTADEEIHAGFAGVMALVEHLHPRLLLSRDLAQLQLNSKRLLINRFQKARPQLAVNLNRGADDSPRQLVHLRRRLWESSLGVLGVLAVCHGLFLPRPPDNSRRN